jgi:hypothetical protein
MVIEGMRRAASCKFFNQQLEKLASLGEQTLLPRTSIWLIRSQLIVKRGKPQQGARCRSFLASTTVSLRMPSEASGPKMKWAKNGLEHEIFQATISVLDAATRAPPLVGSMLGTAQLEPHKD